MQKSDKKLDQAARAAWMYYVAGQTQHEIADALGVSRQVAQRLVACAIDNGLVSVSIAHPVGRCMALAEQVHRHDRLGTTASARDEMSFERGDIHQHRRRLNLDKHRPRAGRSGGGRGSIRFPCTSARLPRSPARPRVAWRRRGFPQQSLRLQARNPRGQQHRFTHAGAGAGRRTGHPLHPAVNAQVVPAAGRHRCDVDGCRPVAGTTGMMIWKRLQPCKRH